VIVGLTGLALIVHVLVPLAPPRMLPDLGFIDLAAKYGQSVYGAYEVGSLSNQFAAMPSLHVGWALLLPIPVILATRSRWSWLFLAHPIITIAVVVGTANHFWLDGIVAAALLLVSMAIAMPFPTPRRIENPRGPRIPGSRNER
jgi:hypothetical protein